MHWFLHADSWRAGEKKSSLCPECSRGVVFDFWCLFLVICENKRRHLLSVSEKRADSVVSAVLVLSPKPVTTNTINSDMEVHK